MIETTDLQTAQMPWEPAPPTTTPAFAPALSPSPNLSSRPEGHVFDISRRCFLEIAMDGNSLLTSMPPASVNMVRSGFLEPQEADVRRGVGSPISLASLRLQCGDIDGAKAALAVAPRSDYWTEHMLAMCHWRAGELALAEDLLRSLAAKNFGDARPLHALGKLLAAQGRFPDAIAALREAARHEDDAPALLNDLAAVLMAEGDPKEALRTLRAALKCAPTYALALANSGVAHQQLGHGDKAADFFRRALVVDDRCVAAVHNLAETLLARHAWNETLELLRPYVERVPEDAHAHELLAWAHMSLNRWRDAQRVLESALRLHGTKNVSLLNNVATVYATVRDTQRAEVAFRQAIQLAPGNSQIRANFAHFLANHGEWERIRQVLRVEDVDGVSDRAALLATAMLASSECQEAVSLLRDAVHRFRELRFYQMLGNTLASRLGLPSEAVDVYRDALSTFTDDLLLNNLGYALILDGRLEEAHSILEPVFRRRREGTDVTSLCVVASYGLLQIRQGRFADGIALYREAYAHGGVMKRRIMQKIQVEEGRHLLAEGNVARAQKVLATAKDGPDPEFRAQALELLPAALN